MLDTKSKERREREFLRSAAHSRYIERQEVKKFKRIEKIMIIFCSSAILVTLPSTALDIIELYSLIIN